MRSFLNAASDPSIQEGGHFWWFAPVAGPGATDSKLLGNVRGDFQGHIFWTSNAHLQFQEVGERNLRGRTALRPRVEGELCSLLLRGGMADTLTRELPVPARLSRLARTPRARPPAVLGRAPGAAAALRSPLRAANLWGGLLAGRRSAAGVQVRWLPPPPLLLFSLLIDVVPAVTSGRALSGPVVPPPVFRRSGFLPTPCDPSVLEARLFPLPRGGGGWTELVLR